MSKQANPMAIGGFVLGALALAVIAILVFSSDALFKSKIRIVTYFPGTVQGLNIGARVEFQGVQIGQVVDIKLQYWQGKGRFRIPVYYDFWPKSLNILGGDSQNEGGISVQATQRLVREQGLRAQLQAVSLVTGQYMITLGLYPESPINVVGEGQAIAEIPAIEATRDRISGMLEGLRLDDLVNSGIGALNAITAMVENPAWQTLAPDVDQVLEEIRRLVTDLDSGVKPLLGQLDQTLTDYAELAQTLKQRVNTLADSIEKTSAQVGTLGRRIESRVEPLANSAQGAFNNAGKALQSANDLLAEDSAPRYNLDLLLQEAASAARSLRLLADYIEQNPDALIKGKY